MRVVTRCAMHLAVRSEGKLGRDDLRRANLSVGIGKCAVVSESDRMIVGKIVGQVDRPGGNRTSRHDNGLRDRSGKYVAQRDRTVVTA